DFSLANIIGVFMNVGLFGGVFYVSIVLQQGLSASPLMAGLQLLPMMVMFVIGNLAFSRLSARLGSRRAIIVGMSAATTAVAVLAFISLGEVSYLSLTVCLSVAHLGLGIASPAMTSVMVNSVEPRDIGIAGAVMNVNRQLGSLIGIAIVAGLLAAATASPLAAAPMIFGLAVAGYAIGAIAGARLHKATRSAEA
ncbi:MFS transporter, partial [Salmonella enterica subsp. enterica serovar Haifa]|nr:MFS transporter [Salmonella enterica subsp. enterica serovar Haifa]